jgi:hypothetical protein
LEQQEIPSIAETPITESTLNVNGYLLEGIAEGVTIENIKEKRTQIIDAHTLLFDSICHKLAGIKLNLSDISYDNEEERRASYTYALAEAAAYNDPAIIVINAEQRHFYTKEEVNEFTKFSTIAKEIIANFTSFTIGEEPFNRGDALLKLATKQKNFLAAQRYWDTECQIDWLRRDWHSIPPEEKEIINALHDLGSIPFQYLGAYAILSSNDLDINETSSGLDALVASDGIKTKAGEDFLYSVNYSLITGKYGLDEEIIQSAWVDLLTAGANYPVANKLAVKQINKEPDSEKWSPGYKKALYVAADILEDRPIIDVLEALTTKVKTVAFADHYIAEFLKQNLSGPSQDKIAEINRISTFVPEVKHILADAIALIAPEGLPEEIVDQATLGYGLWMPAQRLHELQNLYDNGLTVAGDYLALAYATSFDDQNTALARHLGIVTRESFEEGALGDIAHAHQGFAGKLILLGLKGNQTAQALLFRHQVAGFSIIDKLFNDKIATTTTEELPCKSAQAYINTAIKQYLKHAFDVANILTGEHAIPEIFNRDYNGQ